MADSEKKKKKKASILKRLQTETRSIFRRSRSWQETRTQTPTGCFSVYVGPERRRFVIKTESANHPLFRMLLDDAELEYGFGSDGPLLLPCDVDLFCKVLAEMDAAGDGDEVQQRATCSPFNPARRLGRVAGTGSYGLLTPPRLLRINRFS